MCEQCVEADRKIRYYRLLTPRIWDHTLLAGIEGLIAQLLAVKLALHRPEPRSANTRLPS